MVLTMKNYQKSVEIWTQSDEAGGIAGELV